MLTEQETILLTQGEYPILQNSKQQIIFIEQFMLTEQKTMSLTQGE